MSTDGDTVRKALHAMNPFSQTLVRDPALAALARLEAAAAEQPWRVAAVDEQEKRMAAEAMARAEQERADVMQRERDWEQEVVNADLWNRLQAAEAQRDALAEALRAICDIGETRDVEVARAALANTGLIADSDTTTEWKS